MKDLLLDLWARLRASSLSTRLILAGGALLLTLLGGYGVWRGRNPHMEFFMSGLDNTEFSAVTGALGKAGIRFETSSGGAPYTVWVDYSARYDANSVIAQESALEDRPRGIDTSSGSSAFDASIERVQKANARYWEEVEKTLETLTWVERAKVTAFYSDRAVLGRREQPTVSVTLRTKIQDPEPAQSQAVANLVQKAFHTAPENVSIVDHRGQTLFDGTRDERLDEVLAFERTFDRHQSERVQELLDSTYGPGLARATVRGEWTYTRTESVDETLEPKGKVVQERTTKSSTPGLTAAGGPAGVQENLTITPTARGGVNGEPATRQDSTKQYAFGSRTTHTLHTEPTLKRLTLGLILDESISDQLTQAEQVIKNVVGFDSERGDKFSGYATVLHGIDRDEEGNPIHAPAPEPLEAPNPWLERGLTHGIELLAALVFLGVLLRSLKGLRPKPEAGPSPEELAAAMVADQEQAEEPPVELEPEELARLQVEQLIESDPERVSALLSRWAMGEDYYAETSA